MSQSVLDLSKEFAAAALSSLEVPEVSVPPSHNAFSTEALQW
jgi:hypothetical protein